MLSTVLRASSFRVGLALHLAAAIALSFIPLFDVLGFERAFVSGLLAPPIAAAIAIGLARRASSATVLSRFALAAAAGAALLIPTAAAGAIVEAIRQPCDPGEGLVFLLLLGGSGTIFGAALGTAVATITTRRLLPGLAVLAILLAGLASSIGRLYGDPQIFVFDLALGWWPGSLYDEDVRVTAALWAHRGLAVVTAFALVFAARTISGEQRIRSLAATVAFGAAALGLASRGEELGFDLRRETIEAALSRHVVDDRFQLYVDPSISAAQLADLRVDLDLRYEQLTRFFGRSLDDRIHVFVYRDVGQKKRLMGASQTQIARPWAREIHIHGFDSPHPVLKHELAHVFAGQLATGPFLVPAAAGILVNIGVVEGTAVAADWPANGLTVHGWARAMRKLDLAPDPRKTLYPTSFWAISSSRAYTIAGSFIRHLIDRRGIEPFAKLYATNDFEAAYGVPLDELVSEWEAFIDALPLSEGDLLVAEHRFRQPGIFEKACAHTTADLSRRGYQLLAAGDVEGATALLEQVAAYRVGSPDELLAISGFHARAGDVTRARELAERAQGREGISAQSKARVRTALADLAWRAGDLEAARRAYEEVRPESASPAEERLVLAKLTALSRPPEVQAVLRDYLLGELTQPLAIVRIGALARAHPEDGIIRYLYGRLLENARAYAEGIDEVTAAIDAGLPGAPLLREAQLMLGRLYLRAGRSAEARAHFEAVARSSEREADALVARDWAERAALIERADSTRGRAQSSGSTAG